MAGCVVQLAVESALLALSLVMEICMETTAWGDGSGPWSMWRLGGGGKTWKWVAWSRSQVPDPRHFRNFWTPDPLGAGPMGPKRPHPGMTEAGNPLVARRVGQTLVRRRTEIPWWPEGWAKPWYDEGQKSFGGQKGGPHPGTTKARKPLVARGAGPNPGTRRPRNLWRPERPRSHDPVYM